MLKPHPEYDFVDHDQVFVENSDGTVDYFELYYEQELAQWMLVGYTDKHFSTPKRDQEDRIITEPLYAFGYELLNRVAEYDLDELD
jgi:hypothetical protein